MIYVGYGYTDGFSDVLFVAGFEQQGYLIESELTLTQVSVSLSQPHHTPPNVEEGSNKVTSLFIFFTNEH
jgi:hypothetical protein